MAKLHIPVSEAQRALLAKHWSFYEALAHGRRKAGTPAQHHFVDAIRGACVPSTEHELAYLIGRRIMENTSISPEEVVARRFRLSPRDMKDVPLQASDPDQGGAVELRAIDVDRFSSRQRWVQRHNW